jgi:hypothetical protein
MDAHSKRTDRAHLSTDDIGVPSAHCALSPEESPGRSAAQATTQQNERHEHDDESIAASRVTVRVHVPDEVWIDWGHG